MTRQKPPAAAAAMSRFRARSSLFCDCCGLLQSKSTQNVLIILGTNAEPLIRINPIQSKTRVSGLIRRQNKKNK